MLALSAYIAAIVVALPIAILTIECLAAFLKGPYRRSPTPTHTPRQLKAVVLVPAHDEEALLPAALESVQPQLQEGDRLIVVAHNCSDGTKGVAHSYGVGVVEINDAGTGGKPDALKGGLLALDPDPPDVVVVLDADSVAAPGAIDALVRAVKWSDGPVQGRYLFGDAAAGRPSVSSLALLLKNVIRPTGLLTLGRNVLLNGSGSAYPFELLRNAPHGAGSIAEDYQLAIDLAERGHPTSFVPAALISSRLPGGQAAAMGQRRRWEHGHLFLLFRTVPGLLWKGLTQGRPDLLTLGLELSVPPLAFLVLAWLATTLLAGVAALLGNPVGLMLCLWSGAAFAGSVLLAWLRFAGFRTTFTVLGRVPGYVARKAPLYLAYVRGREKRWTKTERDRKAA